MSVWGFLNQVGLLEVLVMFGFALFALVPVGLAVWGIVDAARRPEAQWARAGQGKALWIVLMAIVTIFCSPAGLILTIIYLVSIRPQLDAAGVKGYDIEV